MEDNQRDAESCKSIAIRKLEQLEEIRQARKNAKEMLQERLQQNCEYLEAEKMLKEAKERMKKAKEKALEDRETRDLESKMKDLTHSYNETKKDISVFLVQYNELTGEKEFFTPDGSTVQIVKSAKSRKKKKEKQNKRSLYDKK